MQWPWGLKSRHLGRKQLPCIGVEYTKKVQTDPHSSDCHPPLSQHVSSELESQGTVHDPSTTAQTLLDMYIHCWHEGGHQRSVNTSRHSPFKTSTAPGLLTLRWKFSRPILQASFPPLRPTSQNSHLPHSQHICFRSRLSFIGSFTMITQLGSYLLLASRLLLIRLTKLSQFSGLTYFFFFFWKQPMYRGQEPRFCRVPECRWGSNSQ